MYGVSPPARNEDYHTTLSLTNMKRFRPTLALYFPKISRSNDVNTILMDRTNV